VSDLRSVLVVRLSALGDVLFALPAVQALAASGRVGHLAWLVEDKAAPLLAGVPGLDEVIVFPRRRPLRWPGHALALRRRRDDLVLDLQVNLKSRAQLLLLSAPRKLGFDAPLAREGAERGLTERFTPPASARHRVATHLALVAHLGVPVPEPVPRPGLAVAPAAATQVEGLLSALPGGGPLVVLHPGTSAFGRLKRWAPERFARLGERLVAECGARLVVTGGPGEGPLVDAVRTALSAPSLAAPPGGLELLTALLHRADLVVAADSLPLHLANALGTPVVGLYGPKQPAVTGPFFDRSRVVRSGVACSPCTLRRCADPLCMRRLEVAAVERAARELLAETGR